MRLTLHLIAAAYWLDCIESYSENTPFKQHLIDLPEFSARNIYIKIPQLFEVFFAEWIENTIFGDFAVNSLLFLRTFTRASLIKGVIQDPFYNEFFQNSGIFFKEMLILTPEILHESSGFKISRAALTSLLAYIEFLLFKKLTALSFK